MQTNDLFKEKSKDWDKGDMQVNGAKVIADAIKKQVSLSKDMELIDFGVGTGLLGFEIAKDIKQVHGVDISASMLDKLEAKNTDTLSILAYNRDIIKDPLDQIFDGLISSMTLHHVEDLKLFFDTIYKNTKDGGFIAIADLELEDGSFHSDNTGVFHFGFEEDKLLDIVRASGFKDAKFENINTINKPQRDFGVFLLTALK